MSQPLRVFNGRGALDNPPNRFEKLHLDDGTADIDSGYEREFDEPSAPQTQFFRDNAKSILTRNDSPDVGFEFSINAYRGCEHGCIYCYARPTHEYLGFASGLDFETKIMVKEDAPELLQRELSLPRWNGHTLAMSGVTDCYQPVERKLQLTRRCLEVLVNCRNPVVVITKNRLVTRDLDLLQQLAQYNATSVYISVTTLDKDLARKMEPRTSVPTRRLEAMEKLAAAGVPVGVLVCPVIPGLTDHELPAIIQAARDAGASYAGYNVLHLPYEVKDLFVSWLETHFSEKRDKVVNKILAMRGGKLNDSDFATRMTGSGPFAQHVASLFKLACRKAAMPTCSPRLSSTHFRRPTHGQLELFE